MSRRRYAPQRMDDQMIQTIDRLTNPLKMQWRRNWVISKGGKHAMTMRYKPSDHVFCYSYWALGVPVVKPALEEFDDLPNEVWEQTLLLYREMCLGE